MSSECHYSVACGLLVYQLKRESRWSPKYLAWGTWILFKKYRAEYYSVSVWTWHKLSFVHSVWFFNPCPLIHSDYCCMQVHKSVVLRIICFHYHSAKVCMEELERLVYLQYRGYTERTLHFPEVILLWLRKFWAGVFLFNYKFTVGYIILKKLLESCLLNFQSTCSYHNVQENYTVK